MLVLSRKLGEKIHIGKDIVITVVDIDRGKIRLGIQAPASVPIYRQELLPIQTQEELKDAKSRRRESKPAGPGPEVEFGEGVMPDPKVPPPSKS